MKPLPFDGLQERYYGWLEGRSLKWFEPDLSGPKVTLPLVKLALRFSGEQADDFVERVIHSFDTIVKKHARARVLIVLHWGLLSILNQYLLGKDLSIWREIGPWTSCGVSEFHADGSVWRPVCVDENGHLL